MKSLYSVSSFASHRRGRKCTAKRSNGERSLSLFEVWFKRAEKSTKQISADHVSVSIPCPGLDRQLNPRIDRYLYRSSATGGGAASRQTLAFSLFPEQFPPGAEFRWEMLAQRQRRAVLRQEEVQHVWKNSRAVGAVYAVRCTNTVLCVAGADLEPCQPCQDLFHNHLFQTQLNSRSPIFKRDVDNADNQDDHAAARLFSAQALDFQMVHYPDHKGCSIYLFVCGDMIDAWQNRNITHLERAQMALRARFFFMAWRTHIASHPDHSTNVHFISRQSYNIFLTLCDSLLKLIVVYRRWYPTYPLLPWLHSTEPCEHVFGILRQLKKDFTYVDLLYLQPKLHVLLLGDFSNLTAEEKAKQTSAGYHHTYFRADDLDLLNLLEYPDDTASSKASEAAFEEAKVLLNATGIDATTMLADYKPPPPPLSKPKVKPSPRPETLHTIMAMFQAATFSTSKEEENIGAFEMALAAESVDKSLITQDLPEMTDADFKIICEYIKESEHPQFVSSRSSPSYKPNPVPYAENKVLNREAMVEHRIQHQTREAEEGLRQLGREWLAPPQEETLSVNLRRRLKLLASDKLSRATAGIGRQVRHTGTFTTASEAPAAQSNKEVSREVAAQKFLQHRREIFACVLKIHEGIQDVDITEIQPLRNGHFILALKNQTQKEQPQLVLGEVIAMYSKGNYKGARHEDVSEVKNVGVLSYIYVRTYTLLGHNTFTTMSCPQLNSETFLQIPRTHLLLSLASFSINKQPLATSEFSIIILDSAATALHTQHSRSIIGIGQAVQHLVRAGRSRGSGVALASATRSVLVEADGQAGAEDSDASQE
ncbi:hypothetical protein E1B28_005992 [Marasmius oreades]|uniref:Uncharacterized protein n=1 Tax=Marasmius oreades TaxID=181124 RepID=A0A9P7S4K2_9AGAR|nr:uncharacterized protein E1B28_005992 [Marasmius oreades]KAG7095217.1 hypothetical protein E1B28_005992 [Marasmius oreades]